MSGMRSSAFHRLLASLALSWAFTWPLVAADARIFLALGQRSFSEGGLLSAFAADYRKDNPDERLEIVTCVGEGSVRRWMPGGDLFVEAVRKARQAEAHGQIVGILWLHGSHDARTDAEARAYGWRFESVIGGLRDALGSPVPVVAGRPCGGGPGDAVVAEAVLRTVSSLPRCACATSNRYYRAWNAVANRLIGKYISRDYRVRVDGRPTEVIATPFQETWKAPGRGLFVSSSGRSSYASFTLTEEALVEVSSEELDLSGAVVLPEAQVVEAVQRTKDWLAVRMRPGQQLVVEPSGRERALILAANPVRAAVDAPVNGSGIRYFGPGYHRPGFIELGDNEGLHLAEGAWVEGLVHARGRNITISGPGGISGAPYSWRVGPPRFRAEPGVTRTGAVVTMCGENLTIRDVTIHSGWVYNLAFNEATNALVDNVKVISGRNINDDGIDPCRTKNLTIRNSFVRTQDDCIAPKYWNENLRIENCILWNDGANAIRLGFECEDGRSGRAFRDIAVRDVDVLHMTRVSRGVTNFWTRGVIAVEAAREQVFEKILFEKVRVHECPVIGVFADIRTRDITAGGLPSCHTDEAGYINGLVFRDIRLKKNGSGLLVGMSAHDRRHPLRGIRFENVSGYGPVVTRGEVDFRVVP